MSCGSYMGNDGCGEGKMSNVVMLKSGSVRFSEDWTYGSQFRFRFKPVKFPTQFKRPLERLVFFLKI